MAKLPDPRESASPEALAEIERMASVRSHAEGHAELGQVYISMSTTPRSRSSSAGSASTFASRACCPTRSARA
jgi:hypothetical protein